VFGLLLNHARFSRSQIIQIQDFTKDKLHVTMSYVADNDPAQFSFVDTVKWIILASDAGYISELGIPDGEIIVFDFKGFTWWHLMKVLGNIGVLRAFLRYTQVSGGAYFNQAIHQKFIGVVMILGSGSVSRRSKSLHQLLAGSHEAHYSGQAIHKEGTLREHALPHEQLRHVV
jgi:hypothetical protein